MEIRQLKSLLIVVANYYRQLKETETTDINWKVNDIQTMDNFEEYIRQDQPNKAEKAKDWKTAIGLQKVDQENHLLKNREMHVHYVPPVNDTGKMQNDTVNGTVNDTVCDLIKQNNKITAAEISERLHISLSTAKRKIKELKEKGIVERIGSDKTGYWRIKIV